MNRDLVEIIKLYATKPHIDVSKALLEKSKDSLIAMFNDLLTIYINDKNSSTIREFVTVNLAGYNHSALKIGYNGYKHSSEIGGRPLKCEAKPKNFDTIRYMQKKQEGKSQAKLNGGGNFTDYTLERFNRDLLENPNLLISGFVDGRLIYIFEFPFCAKDFQENLSSQLSKYFKNGKEKNKYLRSANFDYKNWHLENQLKTVYLLEKSELENYKEYINKKFYQWMLLKTQ